MRTKPNIADELIVSRLQEEYGLHVTSLTFLPLGADIGSAVYRVIAEDGTAYFLKLRKGFNEIVVTVPLFLKSQRIKEIIAPCETKSKQGWADFGEYKMILYPFINGKNGFEVEFSDDHWQNLGAALKRIHSAQIPPELKSPIPQETFSPHWRESLKSYQALVENKFFDDPTAAKLVEFMKSKRGEITYLIERAESFASELQSQPLDLVLCHSDIHGGNILISDKEELYLIDWDYPILSPKERDLMFIGGGFIGSGMEDIGRRNLEEALFYEGYGKTSINLLALAYYRYERIINDFSAYCEQLLLTNEGGSDREPAFKTFARNFESGNMIDMADKTYRLLCNQVEGRFYS
jgi:spectinomycin phosphotransferase